MSPSTFVFFSATFCSIWKLQNAFVVPSWTTTPSRGLTLVHMGPDQPGNWFQSESNSFPPLQSDLFRVQQQQQQQRQYDPSGRTYYPETDSPRSPQPQRPEERSPGPLQPQQQRRRSSEDILQGGGSRKTWSTSHHDQTIVQVGSEGRPIYTTAQVWEGPNNTPASMKLYSEDGALRPWNAAFQNGNRGGSSVLDLRNTGPVEFPLEVAVVGKHDGTRGMSKQQREAAPTHRPSLEKVTQTVQGQSLKYFNVKAGVAAVMVELFSEGRPMFAHVELWQGPSNIKQMAEIYSDNGSDRVWSAVIETHGRECTVAVRNVGPALVYPFKASVDPMYHD